MMSWLIAAVFKSPFFDQRRSEVIAFLFKITMSTEFLQSPDKINVLHKRDVLVSPDEIKCAFSNEYGLITIRQ